VSFREHPTLAVRDDFQEPADSRSDLGAFAIADNHARQRLAERWFQMSMNLNVKDNFSPNGRSPGYSVYLPIFVPAVLFLVSLYIRPAMNPDSGIGAVRQSISSPGLPEQAKRRAERKLQGKEGETPRMR